MDSQSRAIRSRRLLMAPVLGGLMGLTLLFPIRETAAGKYSPQHPKVKEAVTRGVEYLRRKTTRGTRGSNSLAALTLIKAGIPPTDPMIRSLISRIVDPIRETKRYRPGANSIYFSTVDVMMLLAAEAESEEKVYQNEIEEILGYITSKQDNGGSWDYFDRASGQGDTSQTQLALLALWHAAENGYHVDTNVWEQAAEWHLETQKENGGFVYHPLGGPSHGVEHGMTVAGITSLAIARRHLFSKVAVLKASGRLRKGKSDAAKSEKKDGSLRFGVVERRKLQPLPRQNSDSKQEGEKKKSSAEVSQSLAKIQAAINRGHNWLANQFTILKVARFELYYVYGLERAATLLDVDIIGGYDWYDEGVEALLSIQNEDGSWKKQSDRVAGTCFAILFLIRSTEQILSGDRRPRSLGDGQLIGGRDFLDDLPDDPRTLSNRDGKVTAQKFSGPIDELLAMLSDPKNQQILEVQEALVNRTRLGDLKDREALIENKELLKKLAKDPRAEVRRTAVWALARCEDLSLVALMIKALGDQSLDVVVEARNGLCTLSRRPLGLGVADHPWNGLPEDATDDRKKHALQEWRAELIGRWGKWYSRVRPYDDRDFLSDE